MRVLVLGREGHVTNAAVTRLEGAGHQIERCAAPGADSFPCRGLTGECPFDAPGSVDVTLLVRDDVWPRPTPHDRGVTCSVRAGTPVALVGKAVLNPYEEWVDLTLVAGDDLVAGVERLAGGDADRPANGVSKGAG